MSTPVTPPSSPATPQLVRSLGLLDATLLVAGSMIGSGIFIVSADIARTTGSTSWLLALAGIPVYWIWKNRHARSSSTTND